MRNKKFLFAAIVILLLLIVALVGSFLFFGSQETESPLTGDPFPESGDAAGVGNGDSATSSPREYWANNTSPGTEIHLLRMLSQEPVAGAVAFTTVDGVRGEEFVRYVERTTGHILDTPLARISDARLISGETMLRIGRVYWSSGATTTLLQRLNGEGTTVYSYLGHFDMMATSTATDTNDVRVKFTGRHLEYENIISAALSSDGRSVFYITKANGGSVGFVEDVRSGSKTQVWSSPLVGLTTQWMGASSVLVYTNPSSIAKGFAWMVNTKTGAKTLVIGDEYALAVKGNAAGTKILYSMEETVNGLISLRVHTVGSTSVQYAPAGISSIIEKCTWDAARDAVLYCAVPRSIVAKRYLEDWQLGITASDDVIWQINIDTGETRQVLDPKSVTTKPFDIVDLHTSPTGEFLVFKNRTNDILWAAHIAPELAPAQNATASSTQVL